MLKLLFSFSLTSIFVFASSGGETGSIPDITMTWAGLVSLIIFQVFIHLQLIGDTLG